jgi:hypothetical protein
MRLAMNIRATRGQGEKADSADEGDGFHGKLARWVVIGSNDRLTRRST